MRNGIGRRCSVRRRRGGFLLTSEHESPAHRSLVAALWLKTWSRLSPIPVTRL